MKGLHILISILMMLAMAGCHSTRYVPVETIRYDTTYINKVQRDSIYHRDSIYVKDKGDTVFIEKYRYLFVDKAVRDALYVTSRDSVQVPYPVEKKLTRWQQFRLDVGGYAIFAVIVVILIVVGRMVYKLKK